MDLDTALTAEAAPSAQAQHPEAANRRARRRRKTPVAVPAAADTLAEDDQSVRQARSQQHAAASCANDQPPLATLETGAAAPVCHTREWLPGAAGAAAKEGGASVLLTDEEEAQIEGDAGDIIDPTHGKSHAHPDQPLPPVDAVYQQTVAGRFCRNQMFASVSGTREEGAARPQSLSGGAGAGSAITGHGDGGDATHAACWNPPPPTELLVATALYTLVVAPSRFAQGLLAGVAAFEAALQFRVGDGAAPLSVLYIYGPAALNFYRLFVWGGLAALSGTVLNAMPRAASSHYDRQPLRQLLDVVLGLCYASVVWLSFSMRQLAYTLSSEWTIRKTPFFAPVRSAYWVQQDFVGEWERSQSLRTARMVLCFATALLSLVPTSDEYFQTKRHAGSSETGSGGAPMRPAEAGVGADPWVSESKHVLGCSSTSRLCGIAFAVGFWSVGSAMSYPHPPMPRAPAGGPALRPIGDHAMKRREYAESVVCTSPQTPVVSPSATHPDLLRRYADAASAVRTTHLFRYSRPRYARLCGSLSTSCSTLLLTACTGVSRCPPSATALLPSAPSSSSSRSSSSGSQPPHRSWCCSSRRRITN